MKLVEGQRYKWCIGKVKNGKILYQNGLFTGEYLSNGKAIFTTKEGDEWTISPDKVHKYLKGRK